MGRNVLSQHHASVTRERRREGIGSGHGNQRTGQKNTPHGVGDAAELPGYGGHPRDQFRLDLGRVLLGNEAAVQAEGDAVGHDVGVDAAGYEANHQSRAGDARDGGSSLGVRGAGAVEVGQDCRRRLQRVAAGVRRGSVRRGPTYFDLKVKATIVGRDYAIRESGAYGVIGPGDPLREEPLGADRATGFFVVGEVELDAAL